MNKKLVLASLFIPTLSLAQVQVEVNGLKVGAGGNGVTITQGAGQSQLAPDTEIEGILVINDQVYIDGIEVPNNKKTYTSPKTGKKYKITRDFNGLSVSEQ